MGSTQILPKELVNLPNLGVLNIHPSLLPKYRGRYSLVHAIFNGENLLVPLRTGWEKIDTGRIISKKKLKF